MIKGYFAFFILAIFPKYVLASSSNAPDLAIGGMIGSFLLVLTCIFVFGYLIKKTNILKNKAGNSPISILSVQYLTPKSRVQIIEVNDQKYLLGVTDHNVTLIDKLDLSEDLKTELSVNISDKQQVNNSPFSTLLSKIKKYSNE